ncbi:MAG: ribonuclease E inhibitor RraB [Pirellulaceae bacterium]
MHTHNEDDALLGVFKQLGLDFKKPREINFNFFFPTETAADMAVRLLAEKKVDSDKMKIDPPWWKRFFAKPTWAVIATRKMSLDEGKIKQITTAFQRIASSCGGDYDGWEANVMGDQIDESKLSNTNP